MTIRLAKKNIKQGEMSTRHADMYAVVRFADVYRASLVCSGR